MNSVNISTQTLTYNPCVSIRMNIIRLYYDNDLLDIADDKVIVEISQKIIDNGNISCSDIIHNNNKMTQTVKPYITKNKNITKYHYYNRKVKLPEKCEKYLTEGLHDELTRTKSIIAGMYPLVLLMNIKSDIKGVWNAREVKHIDIYTHNTDVLYFLLSVYDSKLENVDYSEQLVTSYSIRICDFSFIVCHIRKIYNESHICDIRPFNDYNASEKDCYKYITRKYTMSGYCTFIYNHSIYYNSNTSNGEIYYTSDEFIDTDILSDKGFIVSRVNISSFGRTNINTCLCS
jgi:hypothetical protein